MLNNRQRKKKAEAKAKVKLGRCKGHGAESGALRTGL